MNLTNIVSILLLTQALAFRLTVRKADVTVGEETAVHTLAKEYQFFNAHSPQKQSTQAPPSKPNASKAPSQPPKESTQAPPPKPNASKAPSLPPKQSTQAPQKPAPQSPRPNSPAPSKPSPAPAPAALSGTTSFKSIKASKSARNKLRKACYRNKNTTTVDRRPH